MPTPADLLLPGKFGSWRRVDRKRTQEDIVIAAACTDTRFVILNAPTGIGKSPVYMALSSLLDARTIILTQTKDLQAQLERDFAAMGLVEIKGQNNYECRYFEGEPRRRHPGCDEGPCHAGIECILKEEGCNYYDAVRRAARKRLVVANYAYWMSMQRYAEPGTLGKFDLIILDEAHESARALADFIRIDLSKRDVERLLEIPLPYGSDIVEWVDWADQEALPKCRLKLESARTSASLYHSAISTVRRLRDLEQHLVDLSRAVGWRRVDVADPPAWVPGTSTDWVIEEAKDGVTFQPVWASGYAEDYLFARIPKVVMVSATVTPKDASYLGIPKDAYTYLQYPSPFKREIRPVYSVPTAKVGRRMVRGEERVWINRIDQIIEKEAVQKRQKGIIHAVSYDRAKLIYSQSRFRDIIEIHGRRESRKAVANYKDSDPPYVLLSPSVSTGYDFPMDECRFQIIAKVPFIDSRPAVIRARHRSDRRYLDYTAMVTLIQMCGRGVRSEEDYCITYIVDDNFRNWFYPRNKDLIPKWFKIALRKVQSIREIE